MKYDFHGLIIETVSPDAEISTRWAATFASRPRAEEEPRVRFSLMRVGAVPSAPESEPGFRQGDLLQYHIRGDEVIVHFPRFGQLRLDLSSGAIEGQVVEAALTTHGVFEDFVAIGLSPFLRRRGMFLIHAFAAAVYADSPSPIGRGGRGVRASGRCALVVGDIGAGKTTTGLALLHAGWKLLSNDSPILRDSGIIEVLSYPGLLSAFPDSIRRFPELHPLMDEGEIPHAGHPKRLFAAELFYPDVWTDRALVSAIVFPQIEERTNHALELLSSPDALRRLLPHAIEQWDRAMIPAHLALLTKMVETIPAYRLRLGPEVKELPDVLLSLL